MARGKKKDNLSLEEKLEQALIPVDEYPYKVPENWCWTKLKHGFDITSSKRIHKSDWENKGIPFYRTRELVKLSSNGYVNNELFISELLYETLVEENGRPNCGDLLVSGVGTIGVPYVVSDEDKFYFKDGNVIWLKNKGLFNPEYIFYLFKSVFMKNQIYGMSAGTTVDTYTIVNANETMLPLPPIEEQQRVVEQIENLFSKLDEAKELAQGVIDGYETRNAAIYAEAFSGKLTRSWRRQNNLNNDWKRVRFDEVADIKSNLVLPEDYQEYPHVAPDNIEKRTGILLEYNTIAEDGVTSGKHRFYAGQILYSKIRPYLSKVVMVDFDGLCSADMYPIEAKGNTKYLWYYMLSDDFLEQASTAGSRSVLPKINQKELSAITINIPNEEEQKEVVKVLDRILPISQQVRDNAANVIENIGLMKKAILAKAFRGELGTNIPQEENAIELLKSVLEREG